MGNCILLESVDDPYVYVYVKQYPVERKKYVKCSQVKNESRLSNTDIRFPDSICSVKHYYNRKDDANRKKYQQWKNNSCQHLPNHLK